MVSQNFPVVSVYRSTKRVAVIPPTRLGCMYECGGKENVEHVVPETVHHSVEISFSRR
jgi:hypothetical protein